MTKDDLLFEMYSLIDEMSDWVDDVQVSYDYDGHIPGGQIRLARALVRESLRLMKEYDALPEDAGVAKTTYLRED